MPQSEITNEKAGSKQYIYSFSGGSSEGDASMKNLLGGKGANLAEMANIGLPVPPGFTISTEVCTYYYDNQKNYPRNLFQQDIPPHSAKLKRHSAKNSAILKTHSSSLSAQAQEPQCPA